MKLVLPTDRRILEQLEAGEALFHLKLSAPTLAQRMRTLHGAGWVSRAGHGGRYSLLESGKVALGHLQALESITPVNP